jgi:hypothetical protein
VDVAPLLDLAERPRAGGWSMRAALTRYAQPQPQRASDVIELVRRIEAAVAPQAKALERDGDAASDGFDGALLEAAAELDRLDDVLAAWAVDRAGARPDGEVDAVVADVTERLDAIGVAREDGPPPPRSRRRGV